MSSKKLDVQVIGPDATPAVPDPKPAKKRGLPEEGGPWTMEHDQMLMRRFARMLKAAPPRAVRRMAGYLSSLIDEACVEHIQEVIPTAGRLQEQLQALEKRALSEAGINYQQNAAGSLVPGPYDGKGYPTGR